MYKNTNTIDYNKIEDIQICVAFITLMAIFTIFMILSVNTIKLIV